MSLTSPSHPSTDAGRDRQRPADRGGRDTGKAAVRPDRLPSPPRERRPALAALAVLLIVGGAATAGLLAVRADDRVPVLVASTDIQPGTQITADHFAVTSVAAAEVELIPSSVADQLVGRYATSTIASGRLLDPRMFSTDGLVGSGEAEVGVRVLNGRAPADGLGPGDVVQVVRVQDGQGEPLVDSALVSRVALPADGDSLSATRDPVVTLVVSTRDAAEVAAASAADQVALIRIGRAG